MAADRQIILDTLNRIINESGAAVFTIEDHYVQVAVEGPSEIYCEAVSHHYHSSIDINLESSFVKMGFHLEEGGNYSRRYLGVELKDLRMILFSFLKKSTGLTPRLILK